MNKKQKKWDAVAKKKLTGERQDYRHLPILTRVLRELGDGDNYRVADLGCYNAKDLVEIAQVFESCSFFGYEISPTAVDAAQRLVAESGLDKSVTILQQDLETSLLVPDGYFHISIAKYVLPFIKDKTAFLSEMKRVSSQGIILAVPVVGNAKDVNLSERGRSITMERNEFHRIMYLVFGNAFDVKEVLKDTTDGLIEIEVVVAKTGA